MGLDENDAEKGECASVYLGNGKGGVVDGAERVLGDQEKGKLEGACEVGGGEPRGIGGEEAPGGLYHQEVAAGGRVGKILFEDGQGNLGALETSSGGGGDGGAEGGSGR